MTKKKAPEDLKYPGLRGGYYTYAEARAKVQELGVKGFTAYRTYCQSGDRDPRLPTDPSKTYGGEWQGWPAFCGTTTHVGLGVAKYETYSEASKAAQRLGINTKEEYQARHHEDLRLPAAPHRVYADEWPKSKPWFHFLGKTVYYLTIAQASEAAQLLGIKTKREYDAVHGKDPRLPASPYAVYAEDWKGWMQFLGTT